MNPLSPFAGALIFIAFVAIKYTYDHILRPHWYLRSIPSPPGVSFIEGNTRAILESDPGTVHRQWHKAYGHTFRYDGLLSGPRLCTTDRSALQYVLVSEPYKFPKPTFIRRILASTLGEGLLVAEGMDHKRQRKIINPSFGPAHIKSLYPIFVAKALHLRDAIQKQVGGPSSPARLDLFIYACRAALDVIAAAGFGYETDAIEHGDDNELARAFQTLVGPSAGLTVWRGLVSSFPILENLLDWSWRTNASDHAIRSMRRICAQIVEQQKRDAMATVSIASKNPASLAVEANQFAGRDLLSVLVKANLASDLRPSQRLSDKDVAVQITTFLLAGNETTANAICWAMYGLCRYPETQRKLREEFLNFPGSLYPDSDMPRYDELNTLPYLDAVVRETLRLYAPVASTSRNAEEDCVIPLAEPIIDRNGVKKTEIFIAKNTGIVIPIAHMMTDTSVWGLDAYEFRPERWLTDAVHLLPEGVMEIPSIAFPPFLAGTRACIGFRFAMIEIKTILFSLLRVMQFELAVPADDIEGRSNIVTRPRMKSRRAQGWQLPVNVRPVEDDQP